MATSVEVQFQLGLKRRRVSALPSGADPRTERRAPTAEQAFTKTKSETVLVFGSCLSWLAWLWFLSQARASGSFSLSRRGSCLFFSFSFCFFPLVAVVTFQLLEGGTSDQTLGHRPMNRYRAPTQGPAFSGTSSRTMASWYSHQARKSTSSRLPWSFLSSLLLYFRVCASRPFRTHDGHLVWSSDSNCSHRCHGVFVLLHACTQSEYHTRVRRTSYFALRRWPTFLVFLPEPGSGGLYLLTAVPGWSQRDCASFRPSFLLESCSFAKQVSIQLDLSEVLKEIAACLSLAETAR